MSTGEDYPHVEPHLAVDPRDPSRLVVAAMALPGEGEGLRIRVYTSDDGGESWLGRPLAPRERTRSGSDVDPWLAFSARGELYLSHLPGLVWRSGDGGRSWVGPAVLPREEGAIDAPKTAVDRSGGPHDGRVYTWATQGVDRDGESGVRAGALFRSADGGRSFQGPVRVAPNDFANKGGDVVVLPDGGVLATFHELFHEGDPVASPRYWSLRSTDGGRSFSEPSLVTSGFTAISPYLAVDRGDGPHGGRVYTAWLGLGWDRDHYVAHSDDGGATWSDPRPIVSRTDTTATPTPIALAVSPAGVVGFFWAEPRPDLGPSCFDFRFAVSTDGGASVSRPLAVSDVPSCSDTEGNRRVLLRGARPAGTTVAGRWPTGGDYFGLVSLPDGSFRAVWADSRTGTHQLWTDRIRVDRALRRSPLSGSGDARRARSPSGSG